MQSWPALKWPSAAARAPGIPAAKLPVIDTIFGIGWLTTAAPVSRSPQTTLNTADDQGGDAPRSLRTVDLPERLLVARREVVEGGL
jgi:hypothetical protein